MSRWPTVAVRWPCWPRAHVPLLAQKRDASGAVLRAPHTLVWTCARCGRVLGETRIVLTPAPSAGERPCH